MKVLSYLSVAKCNLNFALDQAQEVFLAPRETDIAPFGVAMPSGLSQGSQELPWLRSMAEPEVTQAMADQSTNKRLSKVIHAK